MTRRAALALLIYLPIHTVLMPVAINWHAAAYPGVYTTLEYNVSYLVVSFAAVLIMGFGYLRREFDTLLDNKMPALITLIQGYFIYILLGYLMVTAILLLAGNITWSNPNDANIVGMAAGDTRKVLAMTVFLGPMIEETLFRGALFGTLRRHSRTAAYVVSIALFALLHVWQYAALGGPALLIYMLDYLPAGFVLAWCYERSGSVWTSIIFHMCVNFSAMSALPP